ncbi:MAG: inositol monophosphatase [Flavobacteriaceae bacterium]|nr:inositol monophosphatase [Flavobacteriaceae bacterium]|tara:strand:- start:923 stop:1651 length:729 start_codon:yes stop_codon:yes gene_type:complete
MINLLNIAKTAALEAADLLRKSKNNIIINKSEGKDIKLQSDLDSENIVIKILRDNSDFDILSEEHGYLKGESNSNLKWIIDPLDGSLNFSRNLPLCCISIALWEDNNPLIGVIFDFNANLLYSGIVGEGAWCNDMSINVSNINKKSNSIICTGFPVYSSFDDKSISSFISEVQDFKKVRLLGSAALSLAFVANGSVEVYKENKIAIWDVAAGLAIVKASGGKIYFHFENNIGDVCADNSKII